MHFIITVIGVVANTCNVLSMCQTLCWMPCICSFLSVSLPRHIVLPDAHFKKRLGRVNNQGHALICGGTGFPPPFCLAPETMLCPPCCVSVVKFHCWLLCCLGAFSLCLPWYPALGLLKNYHFRSVSKWFDLQWSIYAFSLSFCCESCGVKFQPPVLNSNVLLTFDQ